MTRTVVLASVLGLAAIVGLGAYEINAQKHNDPFAAQQAPVAVVPANPSAAGLPPVSPMDTSAAALPPGTPINTSAAALPPGAPINSSNSALAPGSSGIATSSALPPADTMSARQVTQTTTTQNALPPGSSGNLVALTPQVAPAGSTYIVRTTTRTYVRPMHRAYTRHYVKYHKKGKIHVARAVKHSAEFAVKMPGRLTL